LKVDAPVKKTPDAIECLLPI